MMHQSLSWQLICTWLRRERERRNKREWVTCQSLAVVGSRAGSERPILCLSILGVEVLWCLLWSDRSLSTKHEKASRKIGKKRLNYDSASRLLLLEMRSLARRAQLGEAVAKITWARWVKKTSRRAAGNTALLSQQPAVMSHLHV